MRKSFAVLLMTFAPAVFAQQEKNVSIFVSNFEVGSDVNGRSWYADYGAGFEAVFTPRRAIGMTSFPPTASASRMRGSIGTPKRAASDRRTNLQI